MRYLREILIKENEMTLRNKFILGLSLLLVMCTSACAKKVEVTINDESATTTLEVKVSDTIAKILEAAEISLNEEDVVTPSLDEKLEDTVEINIQRMHHVTINVDGEEVSTKMLGGTVKDILAQERIVLSPNMSMNVQEEDALKDNMNIVIESSYGVTIKHDGKEETLNARPGTVKDFLEASNITLGEDDTVTPGLDTEISEGLEIVVERVTFEEVSEVEVIPFEVVRQNNNSMAQGTESIAVAGVNGEKNITYKIKKVDGEEVEREVLKEEVTKQPVNQVVNVGTIPQRYEVSRVNYPNCADGSHGYYEITYSDGSKEYIEY